MITKVHQDLITALQICTGDLLSASLDGTLAIVCLKEFSVKKVANLEVPIRQVAFADPSLILALSGTMIFTYLSWVPDNSVVACYIDIRAH